MLAPGERKAGEEPLAQAPEEVTPKPKRPTSGAALTARISAIVVALFAGWFVLHALVLSGLQEHAAQARLYGDLRSGLAGATSPIAPPITAGTPVALVSVPGIGLRNAVVVEGTSSVQLASGPGHLASTVLPGQAGVSVLYGRSVTYGAPFRGLGSLSAGGRIAVTTQQGAFAYRILDVRRPGQPLPPTVKAGESRLTLVSAGGGGWSQGWAPGDVVYVDATLSKGTVQVPPPALPGIAAVDEAMHGDTDVLTSLVLWLQALLVAVVAVAFAWVRWGRWQTWLIGIPVIVAALWNTSDQALLLLPNLI